MGLSLPDKPRPGRVGRLPATPLDRARAAWDVHGLSLWLCDDCPTPEEIQERADEIRSSWPTWRDDGQPIPGPIEDHDSLSFCCC